ncbi:hypothetical protein TNCV_2864101 [Trichonephila clavipes]|nr:hypothetical protein TNCV_2864101 [Trichonephila clavipes]
MDQPGNSTANGAQMPQPATAIESESPIAFRTRGIESFSDAALNGFCKICGGRFICMTTLWNHLHDDHPASERRARAIDAFPMGFQLERIQEVLPNEEWAANTGPPATVDFLCPPIAPQDMGSGNNSPPGAYGSLDQMTTTLGYYSPVRSTLIVQFGSQIFRQALPSSPPYAAAMGNSCLPRSPVTPP